jgi:hypothetical protein
MKYLGARGTLIHEKNLKPKISCQTPFKVPELVMYTRVLIYSCRYRYRGNWVWNFSRNSIRRVPYLNKGCTGKQQPGFVSLWQRGCVLCVGMMENKVFYFYFLFRSGRSSAATAVLALLTDRRSGNTRIFIQTRGKSLFFSLIVGSGSGTIFSLMRIRTRPFTLMRIQIRLLIKVMQICDHWSSDLQRSILCVHGPLRLHVEPLV